jgi:hypothetical protein
MSEKLGTNLRVSTAYHPQSQGDLEGKHQHLGRILHSYAEGRTDSWDTFLPLVSLAINTSINSSTRYSPSFLVFGRQIPLPSHLAFLPSPPSYAEELTMAQQIGEQLQKIWKIASHHLGKSQANMKQQYDKKTNIKELYVGQIVFVSKPNLDADEKCAKLKNRFDGPFVITAFSKNGVNAFIKPYESKAKDSYRLHINRLKPATPGVIFPFQGEIPKYLLDPNNDEWGTIHENTVTEEKQAYNVSQCPADVQNQSESDITSNCLATKDNVEFPPPLSTEVIPTPSSSLSRQAVSSGSDSNSKERENLDTDTAQKRIHQYNTTHIPTHNYNLRSRNAQQ